MKSRIIDEVRLFILKKGDEKLGLVSLFSIDRIHRKAEFAIIIELAYQGFGYSSEATDYEFSILTLHTLYLIIDEIHERAIYVYVKVGF
jgi:RimJ/RimL family protein N-acetyltransferase